MCWKLFLLLQSVHQTYIGINWSVTEMLPFHLVLVILDTGSQNCEAEQHIVLFCSRKIPYIEIKLKSPNLQFQVSVAV